MTMSDYDRWKTTPPDAYASACEEEGHRFQRNGQCAACGEWDEDRPDYEQDRRDLFG